MEKEFLTRLISEDEDDFENTWGSDEDADDDADDDEDEDDDTEDDADGLEPEEEE